MKKAWTAGIALVLAVVMSVAAFGRWSTIKTTTLNISTSTASASITSLPADLTIEIEIYEDNVLIKSDSTYGSNKQYLSISVPYTFRSGHEYKAIAYFDADGETHTMTRFRN